MSSDDAASLDAAPPRWEPLEGLLPSRHVFGYSAGVKPLLAVAPPSVLVRFLEASLLSGRPWRVHKDIHRLRTIAHEAWMAAQRTPPGLLAASLAALRDLAARYDPIWAETMTRSDRIAVAVQQALQALPDSAK